MSKYRVANGDVIEVLERASDNQFDGVLTDPPYGIDFMDRDWDQGVPGESCWREVRRVLKPGGYLLSFGGTRKWHRLAVAIEDAGFEIVDTIMWLYGSGFPSGYTVSRGLEGEQAERFEGYKTKLKPGWEPVIVAMNPRDGTYANNVEKHGIAGYNVGGCRIGDRERFNPPAGNYDGGVAYNMSVRGMPDDAEGRECGGRFPANVVCGPDVRDDLEPDAHDDQGDFYFYCPKASKSEREAGLEGFEPDTTTDERDKDIDNPDERDKTERKNTHPTVKPIDLCEYLATLILPPERADDTRNLLVPFSGSGSEMIGGVLAGWDTIMGIEREAEHCAVARARLDHWAADNPDETEDRGDLFTLF